MFKAKSKFIAPTLAMLLFGSSLLYADKIYTIEDMSVKEALEKISKESKLSYIVDEGLIEGKKAKNIKNIEGTKEALEKVLKGTNLEAIIEDGTILIREKREKYTSNNGNDLGSVEVIAKSNITEGTGSYTSSVVSIGKIEQALKDIPQAVTVLTNQELKDQNLISLDDALEATTGISKAISPGTGSFFTSRGFNIGSLQYDGVPIERNVYATGSQLNETTVVYDHLEVLRGAAALYQGGDSTGGAVNMVRKRPTKKFSGNLELSAGSWNRYGAQADVGGALNEDGSLRGRAIVDYKQRDSFINYVNTEESTIYLALDYDVSDDTTIGAGFSRYKTDGRLAYGGLPRYEDGSDIGLSRSTFTGADWNETNTTQTSFYLDAKHSFSDNLKLNITSYLLKEENFDIYQYMFGVAESSSYSYFASDYNSDYKGIDVNLIGNYDLFGKEIEFILGTNYQKHTSDDFWASTSIGSADIFNINHNNTYQSIDYMAENAYSLKSKYNNNQKGLYGTVKIKPLDELSIILGGRSSWYDYSYTSSFGNGGSYATPSETKKSADAEFTPMIGIIYELNNQWNIFASYSGVFEPQSNTDINNEMLEAVEGVNYEIGLKGEVNEALNASVTLFRYDHENLAMYDYDAGMVCSGRYCYKASGKVRSEGIDTEIKGQINEQLEISAGYTFTDTEYLDDDDLKGERFSTWTPKHSLKLWGTYKPQNSLKDFEFSLGTVAQSDTLSYDRNFKLAGYSIWNARIGYKPKKNYSFSLNIKNMFDKKYYNSGYNAINRNNYYADPRNIMLTMSYTF